MRLSLALRIGLVVIGVVVAIGGAFGRSLARDTAYDGVLEVRTDGTAIVTEYDTMTASYTVVFEGTSSGAEAYIRQMKATHVDQTGPNIVLAIGMSLVALGFVGRLPRRYSHRTEDESFHPRDLHDELREYYGR